MKIAKLIIKITTILSILATGTLMLPMQSIAQEAASQNEVSIKYSQDLDEFLLAVESMHDLGIAFSMDEATPLQLKESYLQGITAYRRVEFLALYSDGDFVTKHINMPMQQPISPNAVEIDLEGIEGLLVLGELIYSENPVENMEPILMKTGRLLANTKKLVNSEKEKTISLQALYTAIKNQMMNYYTSSINGADASPAETAANRMSVELISMRDYFLMLQASTPEQEAIYPKMVAQLDSFAHFLTDVGSTEGVDRMFFAEQFINPIQQDLMILEGSLKK